MAALKNKRKKNNPLFFFQTARRPSGLLRSRVRHKAAPPLSTIARSVRRLRWQPRHSLQRRLAETLRRLGHRRSAGGRSRPPKNPATLRPAHRPRNGENLQRRARRRRTTTRTTTMMTMLSTMKNRLTTTKPAEATTIRRAPCVDWALPKRATKSSFAQVATGRTTRHAIGQRSQPVSSSPTSTGFALTAIPTSPLAPPPPLPEQSATDATSRPAKRRCCSVPIAPTSVRLPSAYSQQVVYSFFRSPQLPRARCRRACVPAHVRLALLQLHAMPSLSQDGRGRQDGPLRQVRPGTPHLLRLAAHHRRSQGFRLVHLSFVHGSVTNPKKRRRQET